MSYISGRYRAVILLLFAFIASSLAFAQEKASEDTKKDSTSSILLVPILETLFKGELKWRPDWPLDIPCDGFTLSRTDALATDALATDALAQVIELSSEKESFVLRRDANGRLTEFPFFLTDNYVIVKAGYDDSGALLTMSLELKEYASTDDDKDSTKAEDKDSSKGKDSTKTEDKDSSKDKDSTKTDGQSEEKPMIIAFPQDFLPYSELSLGGAFPVITVTADDSQNYVYLFESPLFLTETWYDGEGNMLIFSRADTYVTNGAWRINSLQVNNAGDIQNTDYFFDSYGNITEIRSADSVFSALYAGKMPVNWSLSGLNNELHWDTQGVLTYIRVYEPEGKQLINEYRYEYQNDASGNWVERLETAYVSQYGLLIASPASGRGTWSRRIEY